jgi:hypothetical protein
MSFRHLVEPDKRSITYCAECVIEDLGRHEDGINGGAGGSSVRSSEAMRRLDNRLYGDADLSEALRVWTLDKYS